MDILIFTFIVGLAVAYLIELVALLIPWSWVKHVLTLPLAVGGCWGFGIFGVPLIICACASSCIALFVVFLVNRPTVITNNSTRRQWN